MHIQEVYGVGVKYELLGWRDRGVGVRWRGMVGASQQPFYN